MRPSMVTSPSAGFRFLSENQGKCFATGSSSRSLPASRSCIAAMLVNNLEIEQML